MLNRAKDYYENDKKRLRKQARDKYRNLPQEEKNKKREQSKNRYHNMSEEEKKRLKEYQKNYHEVRKSEYNNCDIIIKQFFNCDITIKQFFNYDLIKYDIQLYIIKSLFHIILDRLV